MNISSFIWNIADDVLRGVYTRGKYRDIILPMTVIRRLDAVLEPTKAAVLARKAELDALDLPPRVPRKTLKKLLDGATWARDRRLQQVAESLMLVVGDAEHDDYAAFEAKVVAAIKAERLLVKPAEARLIARAMSWRASDAQPIVKSLSKKAPDPRGGLFETIVKGKRAIASYERDKGLSDIEIVPFDEPGGIEAFFEREVLPHAGDAWIERSATKIGYEISFARHFYRPKPPRPLAEIKREIDALERQTQTLLDAVLVEADA